MQGWKKPREQWDEDSRMANIRRRKDILASRFSFEAYPAFELIIAGVPEREEDNTQAWLSRWSEAGNHVEWLEASPAFEDVKKQLRMIAMVTSPIWAELGKICMGSSKVDTPPFLPRSVWTWQELGAEELIRLHLMDQQTLDAYVEMHAPPLDDGEREIIAASQALFSPSELAQLEKELKDL